MAKKKAAEVVKQGPVMVEIEYMGKTQKKEQVVPGLVKAGNAFLVQCKVTKAWTYCNEARLNQLTAKFGSQEDLGKNYVGREGKRILKAKAAEIAAQAEAQAEAEVSEK